MAADDVAEKALRRTCHCPSCGNIDTILLYGPMTRQTLKLDESQRVWGSLGEEGVSAFHAQPYMRHITRQPGHADRDCAVHVHETTAAGPILVSVIFEKLTPLKQKLSEWLCTRRIRCLASVPAPIRQPRLQLVIPSWLSKVIAPSLYFVFSAKGLRRRDRIGRGSTSYRHG